MYACMCVSVSYYVGCIKYYVYVCTHTHTNERMDVQMFESTYVSMYVMKFVEIAYTDPYVINIDGVYTW